MNASIEWITSGDCNGLGCCWPIALCNALLYHGHPSPRPGTDDWERLIDIAGCRHGSSIGTDRIRDWLGVVCDPNRLDATSAKIPLALAIIDPKLGPHWVLMIEQKADALRLVNYAGERDQWVELKDLKLETRPNMMDGRILPGDPWWVVPRWRPAQAEVTEVSPLSTEDVSDD